MPRKTTWVNLGIRSGVQNPLTYQTTAQHCTLYIQNDVPCTSSPATFYLIGSILLILQRFVLLLDLQLFFRYHKKHLFIYRYAHKEPHEKRTLPSSVLRENTHSHLGAACFQIYFLSLHFPFNLNFPYCFWGSTLESPAPLQISTTAEIYVFPSPPTCTLSSLSQTQEANLTSVHYNFCTLAHITFSMKPELVFFFQTLH